MYGRNGSIMEHVRQNVEEVLEVSIGLKLPSSNMEEYAMDCQKEQTFVKIVQV